MMKVFVVATCEVQGYGSCWVLSLVREGCEDSRRPTVRISVLSVFVVFSQHFSCEGFYVHVIPNGKRFCTL